MLINTKHILTISKPQQTYINKENGVEIKHPNICIKYINKDYTIIFFKNMDLAEIEYDAIRNFDSEYLFLDFDMQFTESIFYTD